MEPPQEPRRAGDEHRSQSPLHGVSRHRGGSREHRGGARHPDAARRDRPRLDHARRHPEENFRLEDWLLGWPSLRLALRPDAGRDESRHHHDRRREARSTLGGSDAHRVSVVAALLLAAHASAQQPSQPAFTFQEVMIPVRDGVHLQTVILTPTDKTGPLPILFRRTPYGVPDGPLPTVPTSFKELAQDGYILVFQNLRGRFKSEGVFGLTSQVNLADSTSTHETTDAYDTID